VNDEAYFSGGFPVKPSNPKSIYSVTGALTSAIKELSPYTPSSKLLYTLYLLAFGTGDHLILAAL